MGYSFEGKIVNQIPRRRGFAGHLSICEKCCKTIPAPEQESFIIDKKTFLTYNYVNTEYFIYETKGVCSVVYCSKYCRNKHNHRYNK